MESILCYSLFQLLSLPSEVGVFLETYIYTPRVLVYYLINLAAFIFSCIM